MEVTIVIKALNHENRMKMVYILSKYSFCQIHLEKLLGISQTNISRNLNKLVEAGILDFEMTKRKNRYFVNKTFINEYNQLHTKIMEKYNLTPLNTKLEELENTCAKVNNDQI